MKTEKIPTFSDLLSSDDIDSIIKSQIKDSVDLENEIVSVRSYLLDNYGPFGKLNKILTGKETTIEMVKAVIKLNHSNNQ